MNPVILFRKNEAVEEEFEVAKRFFPVVEHRSDIPTNSLVICRYSALPFNKELEYDVENLGSKLIKLGSKIYLDI